MPEYLNDYYDTQKIAAMVADGRHREAVGGLWHELADLQFELLIREGLLPGHRLLDVGCGCLRAGRKFVDYLEPGNYFGIDRCPELLGVGYESELNAEQRSRLPRTNLAAVEDFRVDQFGVEFDFAIAQSVFSHLPLNHLRLCLDRLRAVLRPGAGFYMSYFDVGKDEEWGEPLAHADGEVITHPDRDPYHYEASQLASAAEGMPYSFEPLGDWGHPRGQSLARFGREAPLPGEGPERFLDRESARELPAGAKHYRAYVGPPDRYDFMSATQFALLFSLGLTEASNVLDIGCGSLRLGRLLIPFLESGRYCGVEPEGWLVEDGIERELGPSAVELKKPAFSVRMDYDFSEFGRTFDIVMAQSVATHTGPDQLQAMFSGASAVLGSDGLFAFSFLKDDGAEELPSDGWHYPDNVAYSAVRLREFLGLHGLSSVEIPWFHPGATWMLAARSAEHLPAANDLALLHGRVARGRWSEA